MHPDWVAGISIGAINAALIAGNAPEQRVDKLRAFWEASPPTRCSIGIAAADQLALKGDIARSLFNQLSAAWAPCSAARRASSRRACRRHGCTAGRARGDELLRHHAAQGDAGAARRFRPHQCGRNALQRRRGQRAHRQLRLFRQHDAQDPARARHGERRAAAGLSGRRDRGRILLGRRPRLEHAAAMGGRQPARAQDTLAFQVDLWSARGELPRNMAEVATRQKEIHYSSRTRANTDQFKRCSSVRSAAWRRCWTSCRTN